MVLDWIRLIGHNLRAFPRNLWTTITSARLRDVLPPAIYSVLAWLGRKIPEVIGMGTPAEQIFASIILAIFLLLSVIFSGFALILIIPFMIGISRLFPSINNLWIRVVPRWEGLDLGVR